MASLIDSYSESNQDDYVVSGNGNNENAQSFSVSNKAKLTSVKFYLMKTLLPTGNATAVLYAHSGIYGTSSVGTGSALATSDNFNVSTLTGAYQLIAFTFTGAQQYEMQAGTKYVISFHFEGGNGSNYVRVGVDSSSPSHSGNLSQADPDWTAFAQYDVAFYVYGEISGGGFLLNFL